MHGGAPWNGGDEPQGDLEARSHRPDGAMGARETDAGGGVAGRAPGGAGPGGAPRRPRGLRGAGRIGAIALGGAAAGALAVGLGWPHLALVLAGTPSIQLANVTAAQEAAGSPAAAVYKKLAPSVVLVTNQQAAQQSIFGGTTSATDWGSGVIFSSNGYIVTNYHVVANASQITVTLADGQSYPATLVGGDPSTDLAVIRIHPRTPLTPATFANSDDVQPGQVAIAIGNPLGPEFANSVTEGIISAIRPMLYGFNQSQPRVTSMLQTDAAINPGNSGGPLANAEGDVIGIVSMKTVSTGESGVSASGLGFAIPSNVVSKVANELIQYGYYKWPWLGIGFSSNVSNGLPTQTQTLTIEQVDPNGPSAGKLQAGDVIETWNGKPVLNYYELVGDVSGAQPGQTVTIGVIRDGREVNVRVTLGTEPKADLTATSQSPTPVPVPGGSTPFPFPFPFPFPGSGSGFPGQ
jgi:S1-C subfamily serine protease